MGVASTPVLRDVEDDTSSLASSFGGDIDEEPKSPLLTSHSNVAAPPPPAHQSEARRGSDRVNLLTGGPSITTP